MISYHWTSAIIALAIAGLITWLVRRNHLHARNAIWWIAVALIIAVTGSFPEIVDWVAAKLGISYSPVIALLLGMAVILLKMLKMDIERSKDQQKTRVLAQKVAVLEAELKDKQRSKID